MRDYSLLGAESRLAEERGLVSATWYQPVIPRARLKELMQRRDGPATRFTLLWFALLVGFGVGAFLARHSWWVVPLLAVYGVLYGSASDSRWHEMGHGTAFRTPWKNAFVYNVACFMIMREPTLWRWSHARHHTDSIIVGRDPEIVAMRPPRLLSLMVNFFNLTNVPKAVVKLVLHALGRVSPEERTFIPETEVGTLAKTARVWLSIHAAVIALAIVTHSIWPVLLVGPLPSMYGGWFTLFTGLTQHVGLAEDVLDHRLNTRTVSMNPAFRFLYSNMNYHLEHHLFPLVPYYSLPALHLELRAQTPPPYPSTWSAYREIIPTLWRQRRDPTWCVARSLPAPS